MMKKIVTLFVSVLLLGSIAKAQQPWMDTSKSFHERAVLLVKELTLKEKAQQMGNMVDTEVNRASTLGDYQVFLPIYQYWNEALHGVARSGAATSFPESKGMSATWDKQLIFDCATVISNEARVYNNIYNKGLNYWCPTINMSRDPRWGRDEENYGEDPFLAGMLAVQFIKGMQGNDSKYLKTVACAKHFAANNYEQGRQGSTSFMTKHNLREYYLPAFEMSVKEGKVKSIMSSYNALSTDLNEKNAAGIGWSSSKAWGGKPNAMNDWLLNGILRGEWGFDGYVTSDCAGVSCIYRKVKHFYYGNTFGIYDEGNAEMLATYQAHATADAIKAGNDMNCEFKNQVSIFQTAVEKAIEDDLMTEEDLDQALIRVLETRFALGEFDGSTPWSNLNESDLESTANQAMALKAAQESVVLLKNEKADANDAAPLLPISADKSVALIGPYANQIMLGDYSGTPTYTTTPLQAFATKMNFDISDGTYNFLDYDNFYAKRGETKFRDGDHIGNTSNGDWVVFNEIDFGSGCANFTVSCATKTDAGIGTVNFYLDLDDADIAAATEATAALSVSNESIAAGGWTTYADITANVDPNVFKGKHKVTIKFIGSMSYVGNWKTFRFYNEGANPLEDLGPLYMVQTTNTVNETASEEMINRAVAAAQKADVVVFCGGTNYEKLNDHATGTESHDRFKITMPGNQTELLQALYAVNKNVVLVLETNSSMDITWEKANLPAIIEAWYGGQAQGQAICDVIYGDVNPSGKLTSTWYNRLEELPSKTDSQFGADGMLEYNIDDWGYTYMYYGKGTGANVGRQAAAPMYPFGYGLSYTTFEYSNPTIASDHVTFTITNTGDRAGAEVAQVYVNFPNSSVSHIQKLNRRLVGFERVELAAGQSKEVTIPINKDQLAYYKDDTDEWWVEGGTVNVYISASSADDRLTGSFVTTAEKLDRTASGTPEPEPEEPITGISIPTAAESYISWNDATTLTGAEVENNGANIGSTGANTVATFAIGNNTKQDYVLTFGTAAKDLTAEIEVTLTNSNEEKVLDKVAYVKNTGSWYLNGTETTHSFLISQLPKGNYTLKLATKSTTGSYAGNWGKLAFRAASDYDVIPGTLTLSKGTYSYNKMLENNGANVGYVENGRTATYSFISNTAGKYKMTMDICRYNQGGTMNILIANAETGATEVNYDYTIAADAPGSYTSTDIMLPTEIGTGLKTMTFSFSNGSSYICNYKAPAFTLVEEHHDEPEPVVPTETTDIKANGGTIQNNTWSNGVYTMATTSLDSYNQYFKMNGNNYTISVPADVVVKQVIFKECSNNYPGHDARLQSVTSEGATATIPEDNKFYHSTEGDKHDIVVELANHSAGRDINFNLPKQGQPMCWIQLTIAKQNPETAPQKTDENVTVVNNHAAVAVTFDREIPNDVEATINNTTVTAEGGAATLLFPVWGLNYSTNYTLTIAAGAVKDAYNNTNTDAIEVAVNIPAKAVVAQATYDYVVSDVDELNVAIAAVNESNKNANAARKTIFIKNGDYNLGDFVGQGKSCAQLKCYNVSLIGESREGVIIHGDADGISNPVLNLRDRSGFYLQDLTVRNDRDFGNGLFDGGVAVAIYGGNKTVMKNVCMQSNQDTQVTGDRAYFEDCTIHGTVDFICGGGDNFYYHTDLILENRAGDVIAAPSTNSSNKWGYVFQHCTVKPAEGATVVTDGSWNLGRPWQNEPRTYYLNTTMNVLPDNNGWTNMSNLVTHFYEYNSLEKDGKALDLSVRGNSPSSTNHYTPVLTDEEAAKYTLENVLGGTDSWLPTEECVVLDAPVISLNTNTLSWDAVEDARCYVIFKDGAYLDNQTATTYDTNGAEGVYTVRAANLNGGLGNVSNEIGVGIEVLNENQSYTPSYKPNVKVQLTRSIKADKWSTIILPFAMTSEQMTAAFGAGVQVAELSTASTADNLVFSAVTAMNANQPYAIKVASDFSSATIDDVTIVEPTQMYQTIGATGWQFVGNYVHPGSIAASTANNWNFFFSANKLWKATGTITLNPFRAYFKYTGSSAPAAGSRELSFIINGETTGISNVNDNANFDNDAPMYNLEGQRVNKSYKGIVIMNGKKIVKK